MSINCESPIGFFLKVAAVNALFFSGLIYADTVRLDNGDVISGRLISYQDGVCIFSTRYGATIQLNTADIGSIATDDIYNIIFSNGEKANGRLTYIQNQTVLESPTFGEIKIEVGLIKSITRSFSTEAVDGKPASGASGESFGEESKKEPPLDFLSGSTVLLASGQYEVDFGVMYKQFREAYALPAAGYFQRSAYAAKQVMFDTTIRAGLYDGIEGWISAPFTYSYIEQVSTNDYVRDKDAWDLGDISFGLQYQLVRESSRVPAVSASIAVSAPTGKKKYHDLLNTWQDPLNNGSGHWGISPGLAFVRTTDPAILFGGANFQYFFSETIDGYDVQPGWGAGFYFGVGYALNENLSVGTRFSYSHESNMKVDGEKIYGTDIDPMEISLSASYRFADKWISTPQVTFNLNDDAGSPAISLRIKRQFD